MIGKHSKKILIDDMNFDSHRRSSSLRFFHTNCEWTRTIPVHVNSAWNV